MQLLSFEINEKLYALPVERAKEVVRNAGVTAIPEAADFIEGVLDLRGKIIPVINSRVKLGFPKKDVSMAGAKLSFKMRQPVYFL